MSMGGRSLKMGPAALVAALAIRAQTRAALWGAALDLQATWQDVLNTPGSGRTYKRGSVSHTASKPGDPPAPDTGALRSSIAVVQMDDDTVRVGTGLDYGRFLEFGTKDIEPRPHARPAKDAAWHSMQNVAKAKLGKKGRGG
jgi:hypothetical protein